MTTSKGSTIKLNDTILGYKSLSSKNTRIYQLSRCIFVKFKESHEKPTSEIFPQPNDLM